MESLSKKIHFSRFLYLVLSEDIENKEITRLIIILNMYSFMNSSDILFLNISYDYYFSLDILFIKSL